MADKKCKASDLSAEARVIYDEVKDDVLKVGGEVGTLAGDVKCMIECTGQQAIDAFKRIWDAAKS